MTEIFATVVVASLLGSMHCVGMCGGFVAFYAGDHSHPAGFAHLAYNLGRLLTYVALGAVAGSFGAAVNLAGDASGLRQLAAVVAGSLIMGWGLLMLLQAGGVRWATLPAPAWLNRALGAVLPRLRRRPPVVRAAVLGMASTLLPCGWLYGFAVTAAGTGSPTLGAFVMGAFWLGTVPAMLGVGLGMRTLTRVLGPRLGVLMPLTLVVVGALTITQRGFVAGPPAVVQETDHDRP